MLNAYGAATPSHTVLTHEWERIRHVAAVLERLGSHVHGTRLLET